MRRQHRAREQEPVGVAEAEAFFARARAVVASVNEAGHIRAAMLTFLDSQTEVLVPKRVMTHPSANPPPAPKLAARQTRAVAVEPRRRRPATAALEAPAAAPPPKPSLEGAIEAIRAAPRGLPNSMVLQLLGVTSSDEAFAALTPALRDNRVAARKVDGERRWFGGAPDAAKESEALPPPLRDLLGRVESVLAQSPQGVRVSDIATSLGNASSDEVFAALGLLGREGRAVRMIDGKKRLWFASPPNV